MSNDAVKSLHRETEFLSGVEVNLEAGKGKDLRGTSWKRVTEDDGDRLRALMAENRNYDRELLKSLPANRRVEIHGFERRWLFWKRRTGVAIASVLSPLRHFASATPGDAPPIDLGELLDHVRGLVKERKVSYLVGVCSPTGFTDESRTARFEMPNASVVLVEPDGSGGGWTTATGENVDPQFVKLFDPERAEQKVERVRELIEDHGAELLTGGLSVSSLASKAHLPETVVREGFEQIVRADPELRMTTQNGEAILFRGAPATAGEKKSMNVIDRIKQLFSGDGSESEKINVLAERRASLAQRRERIYEDIGRLETKEADLLEQGKQAKSSVPRRRMAAQLAQMRKDIARQNTTAAMLNKQIDIISTDIHNLTLIQQGEAAQLPDTEELTDHTVQAEEMLETLRADADLVGSLETGMEESLLSEDEQEILREFEASDAPPAQAAEPARDAERSTPAAPDAERIAETPVERRPTCPEVN